MHKYLKKYFATFPSSEQSVDYCNNCKKILNNNNFTNIMKGRNLEKMSRVTIDQILSPIRNFSFLSGKQNPICDTS